MSVENLATMGMVLGGAVKVIAWTSDVESRLR